MHNMTHWAMKDSCVPQPGPVFTGCVCMCLMLVATGKNTTCILMGYRMMLLKPGTLLKHDPNITYPACVSTASSG